MQESIQSINKDTFPYVPIVIVVLLITAAICAYIRAYVKEDIYYFTSEQEVENFDPLMTLHGQY